MNTLRITPRKDNYKGFNLFTAHKFFSDKEEIVFEYSEWGVSFRAVGIDDQNISNVHKNGLKSYSLCIYNVDINHGILTFDESESTEDKIFFNY